MLDKFMKQMAEELGIEGSLSAELPGSYAFPVNDEIAVTISEIPRGFTLGCIFADCPEINCEEFFSQLLFANLYGHGTGGCTLGLDGEGKRLTLSRTIDYNVDYKEFRDLIEDFLNSVDFWTEEVKAYGTKIV